MQGAHLKKNILFAYISQIYIVASNIVALPLYIKFLGVELYGLVGFFILLQSMLALLDIGLTTTLARETAKLKAGVNNSIEYMQVYASVGLIFVFLACVGCSIIYFSAELIAERWLATEYLENDEVINSIQIMAFCIGFRFIGSLQKSVIIGNELIVWNSVFNIISITFKNGVVFLMLFILGAEAKVFFGFQLFVAISELIILTIKSVSLLPKQNKNQITKIRLAISPIKPLLAFTLSSALSSSLWIIVTQSDKILMSNFLTLKDFGYFTLAISISSTISLISSPVNATMAPRLTILLSNGNIEEFKLMYKKATQLVAVLAGSISIFLVFFSENIVYLWIGNKDLVDNVAPLVSLYAIGYGVAALGSLPYLVQYSHGNLKLHMLGTIFFLVIMVLSLYLLTSRYQALGAGYSWILTNLLYFLIWPFLIHRKFIPNFHSFWILNDIFKIITPPIIFAAIISQFMAFEGGKIIVFFQLAVIGVWILISSIFSSSFLRKHLFLFFQEIKKRT